MNSLTLLNGVPCNVCRTCLQRYNANDPSTFKNIEDFVYHGMIKVKLIDMLIFLNCIDIDIEENWPHAMCITCVKAAIQAFGFKRRCIEANEILSRHSQPTSRISQRMNYFVNLDHEYDNLSYPSECRLS